MDHQKLSASLKVEDVGAIGNARFLSGYIYDDEAGRFKDGYPIYTSMIVEVQWEDGAPIAVETRNTIYSILSISEDAIMWLAEEVGVE